jgi:hypothetical protein
VPPCQTCNFRRHSDWTALEVIALLDDLNIGFEVDEALIDRSYLAWNNGEGFSKRPNRILNLFEKKNPRGDRLLLY